ncbi:MAG: PEP-CTERM sorting domain-containing protein [Pseudomonadales bacterium]|nr:PEP-CTERM sorting domain-containing protein [Pseudomonadales bacterium]
MPDVYPSTWQNDPDWLISGQDGTPEWTGIIDLADMASQRQIVRTIPDVPTPRQSPPPKQQIAEDDSRLPPKPEKEPEDEPKIPPVVIPPGDNDPIIPVIQLPVSVPEPSALALLIPGLMLMVWRRRKDR